MNKYAKLFFHRVAKDLRQRELIPLKVLFFMHSSTILVLYPYLTIHMRELGINVEETAIMSAVTPVVAILMPPVAGMIADKIGNFRLLLSFFSVVGGASALLLLLVPAGRVTVTYPNETILGLSCRTNMSPALILNQEYPCNVRNSSDVLETELTIESCGYSCHAVLSDNFSNEVLKTRQYQVSTYDLETNTSVTYAYELSDLDFFDYVDVSKAKKHAILKNNPRYLTSIRKLSMNRYYFPTNHLSNFSCDVGNSELVKCMIGSKHHFKGFDKLSNTFKAGLALQEVSKDDKDENRNRFAINYVENSIKDNLKCTESPEATKKHIAVSIPISDPNSTVQNLDIGSCSKTCLATSPRSNICTNKKTVLELDMSVTFWSYLVIRVFVGIVSGTSFAMFEGAVIAILREHKADYGLQRIYATIGGMMSSPLSGWLIDFASEGKSYTDFRPIFFLYASLKIFSGILMLFIDLEFKQSAKSVVADVLNVLKKIELIALFTSCLILGCAWGFIESFLFWLLEDLGGSKSLMGLTITVGGIIGIPLLVLSGPIVKKLGHANVIFIGFIFYAIRLCGYSLIYNPWLCLVFEAMESITFGLSFTAAVTYAARLSTVTTDTSIQGMLGGLYYGVGKGVGSLIGGYLIKPIGIRHTFQVFALGTTVTGVIYFMFYHLYMKRWPSEGTDITKKDVEKEKSPEGFEDVALKGKNELGLEVPAFYEDAMCNPAYEATEGEEDVIQNNGQNVNK